MSITLDHICLGSTYTIEHIECENTEWFGRFEDLGFLPGETVKLLVDTYGRDPLAVRVGQSTWALRCVEAACVHVKLIDNINKSVII